MIRCKGAALPNGQIGPFSLSQGHRVSVVWRHDYPGWSDDFHTFLAAIQGTIAIPGLEVLSQLHVVDIWTTKPSAKKVVDILRLNSRDETSRFGVSCNVPVDRRFVDLPGTPRTLVALESVRKTHMAICLVLGGLDPIGIATVRDYVATALRQHAILEVLLPTTNLSEFFHGQPLVEVVQLASGLGNEKAL